MINPLLVIAGTILVGSLFYNGILKFEVNDLRDEVVTLEMKLNESSMNNQVLKGAIQTRNEVIEDYRLALAENQNELDEWKSRPEKVRYNTIYKNIPVNVDIRGEDCETTKRAIDAVRAINFNNI